MAAPYFSPATIAEAAGLRARHGAVPIAGGTVALAVDQRPLHAAWPVLDLSRTGTDRYERDGDAAMLGATATYRTVMDASELRSAVPLLPLMASGVTGGPQLRNRATLGGSACFANPASEAPACLVALDASMIVVGVSGERRIPIQDFFRGPFRTALGADELLAAIAIPVSVPPVATGYVKIKVSESSWPLATAAVVATGRTTRIAVGATSGVPLCIEVPGMPGDLESGAVGELVRRAGDDVGWWGDELGPSDYRRRIAAAAAAKALSRAVLSMAS